MPTKIRLQRHGKKGKPFYHIVIADGRAPRDGKFIEKIGTYNPIANPAEINLDFDRAYKWLSNGAQPTKTVNSILSYKGVLLYNHLMKGVAKGALTKETAEVRFQEWVNSKEAKINSKIKANETARKEEQKKRLQNEVKVNEAKAAEIAKKTQEKAAIANAEKTQEENVNNELVNETETNGEEVSN